MALDRGSLDPHGVAKPRFCFDGELVTLFLGFTGASMLRAGTASTICTHVNASSRWLVPPAQERL
jgi:hypothetical protein